MRGQTLCSHGGRRGQPPCHPRSRSPSARWEGGRRAPCSRARHVPGGKMGAAALFPRPRSPRARWEDGAGALPPHIGMAKANASYKWEGSVCPLLMPQPKWEENVCPLLPTSTTAIFRNRRLRGPCQSHADVRQRPQHFQGWGRRQGGLVRERRFPHP